MLRNSTFKFIAGHQSRCFIHNSRTLLIEKSASPSFDVNAAAKKFDLSPQVLTQALTHKSYKHGKVPSNERLQYVGRRSLEYFVVEAGVKTDKSVDQLTNAIKNSTNHTYLESRFDALGLEEGVQCHLSGDDVPRLVKSRSMEALIGAIYHERGLDAAKKFVNENNLLSI